MAQSFRLYKIQAQRPGSVVSELREGNRRLKVTGSNRDDNALEPRKVTPMRPTSTIHDLSRAVSPADGEAAR